MNLLYNKVLLLPYFWNYSLFKKNFEDIVNDPQYSLLCLSMIKKKKSIIFLRNFFFLNFRKKRLNVIFKATLIIFKKLKNKPFLVNVKTLLLYQIFVNSIKLCLKKIFFFIPFKYRSEFIPLKKGFLVKFTSLQTFHTIGFKVMPQTSNLLKGVFKFIKKLFINKEFIGYFFQLFKLLLKLKTRKTFFRLLFQIESYFNTLYYNQVDCWFFYFSSQLLLSFNTKYNSINKKLSAFIKKALNSCKGNYFLILQSKLFKLKKKAKTSIFIKYIRTNKTVLIFFTGSIFQLYCYKKQISFFFKNIFRLINAISIDNVYILGFKFHIFCGFLKEPLKNAKHMNIVHCTFKKLVPFKHLKKIFTYLGFLSYQKKPKNLRKIINFLSFDILNWYSFLIFGLHKYYFTASNAKMLQLSIYYILKWSFLYTLAKKHKQTVFFILIKYLKYTKFFFKVFTKKPQSIKVFKTMLFGKNYFFNYSFENIGDVI